MKLSEIKHTIALSLLAVFLLIMLGGCGIALPYQTALMSSTPKALLETPTYPPAVFTAAVKTVKAYQTTVGPTATPTSTPTFTATFTPTMTSTPTPTATRPTSTPTRTYTSTPVPCNLAKFITDVNLPDGSEVDANTRFTKTWRLKNIGTCTWDTDYQIEFVNGYRMGAKKLIPLPAKVAPGKMIDISITMLAPKELGKFTGSWMLRSSSGKKFGLIGDDPAFHVAVKVTLQSAVNTPYDFTDHYCDALWKSGSEIILPCPGKSSDEKGYVYKASSVKLEDGTVASDPVLVMRPKMVKNGVIWGRFPPVKIKKGNHFRMKIGCLADNPACKVTFYLKYRIGYNETKNLAKWVQTSDGVIQTVDLDLARFAGKNVQFFFRVEGGSSAKDDIVFWQDPVVGP